jgi:hypothetical protein
MKLASKPLPHGKQTVTPYIIVKGAAQFIDFLERSFLMHMSSGGRRTPTAQLACGGAGWEFYSHDR